MRQTLHSAPRRPAGTRDWRAAATLPLLLMVLLGGASPARADEYPRRGLPVLTDIKAIRALSQDGGARGYPVRIRGTVTHFDEIGKNSLIVHDGAVGQFVSNPADQELVGPWNHLQTGDYIEVVGRTERGGFAPNVKPERIRRLGTAHLPPIRRIPYSAMLTGRHDCDFVEITGVVQRIWHSSDTTRTRLMFAEVATEEGVVRAAFWEYEPRDASRLIDARVRLRGNVGTIFGPSEQLRGVSLFAGRMREMELLEPAPDPFALPARPSRRIYNYSSAGEVNRRIRVRGVVTAVVPGHPVAITDFTTTATFRYVLNVIYLKDASGGVRIETEQQPDVRPGQIVDAAGFPGVTPGRPRLKNATFRLVRGARPAPAVPIAATGGLTPDYDAELVRMDAELLSVLDGPTGRVLVLKARDTVFNARIAVADPPTPVDVLRAGSLVSLTGVYAYQAGPPPSFQLFVRDAADIQMLAEAPWWTLRHTGVMVLMLGLVAGVGTVGMRTHARRKRRAYQAVLSERIRVARELHDTIEQGMAGISLQLEAVAGNLNTSPDAARRSLDVAKQMLRYSLEETRRSVLDLRSQALESRDLVGALTDLAHQMTAGGQTTAHVKVTGTPRRFDAAEEHHLLRIGLEALTNALKHAGASRIDIELAFRNDGTSLVVRDNGRGLCPGTREPQGEHFGLKGVRERVDKLGGVLHINSEPGHGTRLAVTVPVRPPALLGGEVFQP
jgi:signal transduction histidine kinase